MKTLQAVAASLTLAVVMGQPLSAAADTPQADWLTGAFTEGVSLDQAQFLDQDAMSDGRGQAFPLMGVVAGIAGLDLALMSFYWGYYVPIVSSGGGLCHGCSLYSQH